MLTYLAALSSFSLMIGIGILFRFLSVASAWLILLFALCSLLLRLFYLLPYEGTIDLYTQFTERMEHWNGQNGQI